jgi:hypothetical protein
MSSASSAARLLVERGMVPGSLADVETRDKLRHLVRPTSISKTLRRAGVGLVLAPDPITVVPGAILLGVSFATRGREPLSPASVFNETRKLLAEICSYL